MHIRRVLGVGTTAVMLALLAMACGQTGPAKAADASAPPAAKPDRQIRGFSMQLTDPNGTDGYIKAIDDIAALGCTAINFAFAAKQDQIHSETLAINWKKIPSQRDLETILKHAKAKGIYTIVMPMVLLNNSGPKEWRGVIDPPDWDIWFDSYRQYVTQVAKIAARCDVDLMCVGSELLSTEPKKDQWVQTIAAVRADFKGKLTYSANWDHYDPDTSKGSLGGPTFWSQLDYIGMNNYNELVDHPGASVEEITKKWTPIKTKVLDFAKKEGKPFFFTEVGWHNLKNTLKEPWNYVAEGEIDLNEQLHAYQAFVEAWKDTPNTQFMGALVWEWTPGGNGKTDHGTYTLQNTPAMDVVKKWMMER